LRNNFPMDMWFDKRERHDIPNPIIFGYEETTAMRLRLLSIVNDLGSLTMSRKSVLPTVHAVPMNERCSTSWFGGSDLTAPFTPPGAKRSVQSTREHPLQCRLASHHPS
jgi:hypothetical protein